MGILPSGFIRVNDSEKGNNMTKAARNYPDGFCFYEDL
jgi:hypothetical protein